MARDYDSTIARIAGNLLSGALLYPLDEDMQTPDDLDREFAVRAVARARAIVAEVRRTEDPLCVCGHTEANHETVEYRGDKSRSCLQCWGAERCMAFTRK